MLKRTPLFSSHQQLGARLVEFGGWEMPVQYTSITDEHLTVRNAAGIFDISHMGEVEVSGPGALSGLNQLLTNDLRKLSIGQGQYTLMCHEGGGVIDDLYAYRVGEESYLLIINASRIGPDVTWLEEHLGTNGVKLSDVSEAFGAVAVQGPRVTEFIDRCFSGPSQGGTAVDKISDLKKNQIARLSWTGGTHFWISRTGYTGEDGFEIVAPAEIIVAIWDHVLAVGRPSGLKPAGLGARDTLRTEVCYPLYGHELDEQTTPMEAGLGYFVSFEKGEFLGRSILAEQKAKGVSRTCIGFKMTGKSAPPRPGYSIWNVGATEKIGTVSSGTQSPSLNLGIGLGFVPTPFASEGTLIGIEARGKLSEAVIVRKPIFRKASTPAPK